MIVSENIYFYSELFVIRYFATGLHFSNVIHGGR